MTTTSRASATDAGGFCNCCLWNTRYYNGQNLCRCSDSSDKEWRCNGCGQRYAEYVNGCVKCWEPNLTVQENRRKYPKRKVELVPKVVNR